MGTETLPIPAEGVAADVFGATGATPFGWAALGLKAFGGTSINKSGAAAQAEGGYGAFGAKNSGGINSALIEFDNPVHVAVAAAAVVAIVYVIKKWGKK